MQCLMCKLEEREDIKSDLTASWIQTSRGAGKSKQRLMCLVSIELMYHLLTVSHGSDRSYFCSCRGEPESTAATADLFQYRSVTFNFLDAALPGALQPVVQASPRLFAWTAESDVYC